MDMIRYAGYDPDENDFSTIELTPLHWLWSDSRRPRRRGEIDARRAAELRAAGMTWDEVALELTYEAGRPIRFTGQSVSAAVCRENRKV